MTIVLHAGRIALLGTLVLGAGGTWYLMYTNNFLKTMLSLPKDTYPAIPGTNIALRTKWTTIEPIDNNITGLLAFFALLFEPENLRLLLQAFHFYGLWASAWLLMQVEAYRVGNSWSPISFITIWGLLAENIAVGVILPLWCFLHLLLSPTIGSGRSEIAKRTSILVHPLELAVLPWSLAIGLGIPSILSSVLPSEDYGSFWASKQFWLVLRIAHPLLSAITHLILSILIRPGSVEFESAQQRDQSIVRNLQTIYPIATYISVIPHIATVTLCLLSTTSPSLFADESRAAFDPVAMYTPAPFWSSPALIPHIKSFAEGAGYFLQWDEIAGSLAILIWAFVINRDALPHHGKGSGLLTAIVKTAVITVLGGPGAAAVALIHERDLTLLDYAPDEQQARKKKTK